MVKYRGRKSYIVAAYFRCSGQSPQHGCSEFEPSMPVVLPQGKVRHMRKAIGIGSFGAMAIVAMFLLSSIPMAVAGDMYSANWPLMAGKNTDAGDIDVTHDNVNVYVTYTTTGNWKLSETHVAVSFQEDCPENENPIAINPKNGNPAPGQFPYKTTHNPMVTTFTYTIPFPQGFEWGEYVCIATHAVVKKINNCGQVVKEETAWAGNHEFTGKNWAKFFCYQPGNPSKILQNLPSTARVSYVVDRSTDSYWDVSFPDYAPTHYLNVKGIGWCVEAGQTIGGTVSGIEIISSIDENNNNVQVKDTYGNWITITDAMWSEINWIINNDVGKSWSDTQYAIWAIIGHIPASGNTVYISYDGPLNINNLPAGADYLYDQAQLHTNYIPHAGQWIAVILHTATQQDCIVEVDP
jgi:hypothetical protein